MTLAEEEVSKVTRKYCMESGFVVHMLESLKSAWAIFGVSLCFNESGEERKRGKDGGRGGDSRVDPLLQQNGLLWLCSWNPKSPGRISSQGNWLYLFPGVGG